MNPILAAATPADRLLRQHYRWTRLGWPLATLSVGLASTLTLDWHRHPSLQRVEQWGSLPGQWAAGVGLTLLGALGVWLVRRQSLPHAARRLDERLNAKNRLETAASAHADASAVADAQRAEATAFLQGQPVSRPWLDPILVLGALAAVLAASHLFTLVSWTRPWLWPARETAKPPAPRAEAALPKAHIAWKSPASETKATPIEEVPLQAVADSTTGLRDLVLEIAVNGQRRMNVPVTLDELRIPGSHPVQASIYLDQVEVEPCDVVSYYLRAQRIDSRHLPETTSPVQFVQIKPFRTDVREMVGKEGSEVFALITALKVAQLRLIKENFVLAHAELDHASPEWKTENGRVGGEQAALRKKTGEAVQQMIEESIPPAVVDLLNQAQPLMGEAAQKIGAAANEPALVPQGKALALITQLEKDAFKLAPHGGSSHAPKPNINDPFGDKQQFEMKQRFKTAAGELEMLVAAQAKLAEDLARPEETTSPPASPPDAPAVTPDPNKIEGTAAERQTQISQRVGALLTGRIFKPEIVQHLEQGREQARESLRRLDADDPPAAREPAAAAARELQLALDAMNRAGEAQARLDLADAQKALNEAADQARDAARQPSSAAAAQRAEQAAQRTGQAAKDLAEAARAQQETGSSDAAKRLNELAKGISAEATRNALERLRAQPRSPESAQAAADQLRLMAERAARQQYPGSPSPEEISRLAERLERARANMQRLAMNGVPANPALPPADGTAERTPAPDGNSAQGQEPPGTGPADRPQDQPGQSPGQGKSGPPGQPAPDKPGQGQGKQPGQQGRGQGPQGKTGQGQGQPKPGQGQPGQGENGASGSQTASHGSGSGHSTASGNDNDDAANWEDHTNQADRTPARSRPPAGDTYGTKVGELQSGAIPTADGSTRTPTYSDHAPRTARTRDPQQTKEEFARELVEDVRESAQDASAIVPKSESLADIREVLSDVPVELHYADQAALFAKIDPPLVGLIDLLHAEAQRARRAYQLTEKNTDLAPAAYRPAVADYFEQLSRDYDGAPPVPDTETK